MPESVVDFMASVLGTTCYNCLGWALSENKWLAIPGKGFADQKATIKEIQAFLSLHLGIENRKLFDIPVVKKFDIPSYDLETLKEGTVAFYFHKSSSILFWDHAARYTESIIQDDKEVHLQQWTSKLGMASLVAHKEAETIECVYFGRDIILYANPLEYLVASSTTENNQYSHPDL